MKTKSFKTKQRGVTLFELLAVISIGVIISAISITSYFTLKDRHALSKDVDSIVSLVEKTRNMSLNRKNDSSYGVYFSTSTVTSYAGASISLGNVLTVYSIENPVSVSSISLSTGGRDVHFTKITGVPSATGTISIGTNSRTRVITIFGTGIIESN